MMINGGLLGQVCPEICGMLVPVSSGPICVSTYRHQWPP